MLLFLLSWFTCSFLLSPLIGHWLRHVQQDYPVAPPYPAPTPEHPQGMPLS
jgi:hypothetical protein